MNFPQPPGTTSSSCDFRRRTPEHQASISIDDVPASFLLSRTTASLQASRWNSSISSTSSRSAVRVAWARSPWRNECRAASRRARTCSTLVSVSTPSAMRMARHPSPHSATEASSPVSIASRSDRSDVTAPSSSINLCHAGETLERARWPGWGFDVSSFTHASSVCSEPRGERSTKQGS